MLLKRQKKSMYIYIYIYKYTKLYMRDRQTWGQACWRESGSRGVDTLAPLPWVTLLLSFCALMSLLPPLSPLPHPSVPTQVIPLFPLPSVAPSTIFSSSGGAQPIRQKTLPQARGPEESLAPLVSTGKPPSSSSSYARPCPGFPCPVDAHSSASHRKEEL